MQLKTLARKATTADLLGVLDLQKKNLVNFLSEEQKQDGFVTTPFTIEQLEALVEREGLFVLDDQGRVGGYTVAAGWDSFVGRPLFELMELRFSRVTFHGHPILRSNSFQYGPVCVDSLHRGTDAFPRLFDCMKQAMASRFQVGTTFINQINTRSFRAHTEKVGLEVIDRFEFSGNQYWGLAFLTR